MASIPLLVQAGIDGELGLVRVPPMPPQLPKDVLGSGLLGTRSVGQLQSRNRNEIYQASSTARPHRKEGHILLSPVTM